MLHIRRVGLFGSPSEKCHPVFFCSSGVDSSGLTNYGTSRNNPASGPLELSLDFVVDLCSNKGSELVKFGQKKAKNFEPKL